MDFIRCTLVGDKKYFFYKGKRIKPVVSDNLISSGIKLGRCLSVQERKLLLNELLLGSTMMMKNIPKLSTLHIAWNVNVEKKRREIQ